MEENYENVLLVGTPVSNGSTKASKQKESANTEMGPPRREAVMQWVKAE